MAEDHCRIKGGGSIGRAAVSKTAGCRFESCPPCNLASKWCGLAMRGERLTSKGSANSEELSEIEGKKRGEKRGFFGSIALFLRQVVSEIKKVVTPTRSELVRFTLVVLVFVIIIIAFVFGLDQIYGWLVVLLFGDPALT